MKALHQIGADSGDEVAERLESDGAGLPQDQESCSAEG